MGKLFSVALGILTAIGGFLDIGDLVTNAVVGSRFGLASGSIHPRKAIHDSPAPAHRPGGASKVGPTAGPA